MGMAEMLKVWVVGLAWLWVGFNENDRLLWRSWDDMQRWYYDLDTRVRFWLQDWDREHRRANE
jgi:hypothetical protein